MTLKPLRQFFLGVLGWSPKTLMEEASLEDIVDARRGHAAQELPPAFPAQGFMDEMTARFPDRRPAR